MPESPVPESNLAEKRCKPCEGGTPPFPPSLISGYLSQMPGWELVDGKIVKTFTFKNYYETMAFVNASAWVSHQEDHHPNLEVGYKTCKVIYFTHSIKGLSENDFICAAKLDKLIKQS